MLLTPPGSATGISIRWLIAAAACGLFVSGTVGALLGTSLLQRVPAGFPGIAVFVASAPALESGRVRGLARGIVDRRDPPG